MSTDPSRFVRDLKPGQPVSIKSGAFAGLQGVVTEFHTAGGEPEPTTKVRVNVTLPAAVRPPSCCGIAPVEFINPTVDELDPI
jgi:transcription antitermination factor NusG